MASSIRPIAKPAALAAAKPAGLSAPKFSTRLPAGTVLQRKCACGNDAGAGGSCEQCAAKKQEAIQRKAATAEAQPTSAAEARFEAEADHVAERVLSPAQPASSTTQTVRSAPPAIQRRSSNSAHTMPEEVPPQVAAALAASGKPLDASSRQFFEPRFGHDFSRVRVHVDDAATDSVSAHAFTVGERIVFASNQYRPATDAGRRLLAHELTHVVQQTHPGPASPPSTLEAQARMAGHSIPTHRGFPGAIPAAAARPGTLQREEANDAPGEVRVIPKENGRVAVVMMKNGKIVQGYADIQPPKGMSASQAASQIQTRVTGTGPRPKVDVIVPPGWGRQATNPAAKVEVKDTAAVEREDLAAKRKAKADDVRNLYRQYLEDYQFQYEKFGTTLTNFGNPLGNAADTKSDDEILAMQGDNFFFEWMQRRQRTKDWQRFQAQARAMGYEDAEGIKEMFKQYRQPGLQTEQEGDKQLHDLKYEPEKALQQNYASPLLLKWMASDPTPVDVPGDDGKKKVYVLPLPDGNVTTLTPAQYNKLRQLAKDRIETRLNTVETQKGLYETHKKDRGTASKALDYVYGAKLEGKSWGAVDDSVKSGRAALKKGDLKASLDSLGEAEQQESAARKEWDKYLHNREVGAEVTISGLEAIKTGSEIVLAVGTAPLGGTGLLIVTGKGVTESLVLAAAKQGGGQHVDWGDVAFDVGTQVVTAAAMHGFSKVLALGPGNKIMNAIRENYGAQVATDIVQSVLVDSATNAAKQAYEAARGRGEKFTAEDFLKHFKKYITDPSGLPLDVVKAQLARRVGGLGKSGGAHGEAAPGHEGAPAHEGSAERPSQPTGTPEKAATGSVEHPTAALEHPPAAAAPEHGGGSQAAGKPEAPGKGTATSEAQQKASLSIDASGTGAGGKPAEAKGKAGKSLPEAHAEELRELAKDPERVKPVTDPELRNQGYEVEISSGKRTYRRKKDGTWCRWASPKECGFTVDLGTAATVDKAAAENDKKPKPAAQEPDQKPDVGLADQGYRAQAGERVESKEAYKQRRSDERWDKRADKMLSVLDTGAPVERATGGASNQRIGGKAVPGEARPRLDMDSVPRRAGETQKQALDRVNGVIGKTISDHPLLEQLWNNARASVTKKNPLSQSNYEDLYNRTRSAFWRRVRGNAQATKILGDAGFAQSGGKTSAPLLSGVSSTIPVEETRISLDHIDEKAQGDNWKKALDANNLRFEFSQANTEREIKQMRHPELRP
jgi:hypothetical protein